jgi:hypothetical protein
MGHLEGFRGLETEMVVGFEDRDKGQGEDLLYCGWALLHAPDTA